MKLRNNRLFVCFFRTTANRQSQTAASPTTAISSFHGIRVRFFVSLLLPRLVCLFIFLYSISQYFGHSSLRGRRRFSTISSPMSMVGARFQRRDIRAWQAPRSSVRTFYFGPAAHLSHTPTGLSEAHTTKKKEKKER